MSSGKQSMTLIQDEIQRKECYKNRKDELLQKAKELSFCFGVDTCIIAYNPYNGEAETWPQSYDEVMKLVSMFENLYAMDKSPRIFNQEGFVKEIIRKTEEKIQKLRSNNRQKEIKRVVSQHMKGQRDSMFTPSDLKDLWEFATGKVDKISQILDVVKKGSTTRVSSAQLPPPPPPPTLPTPPASPPLAETEQTTDAVQEGDLYKPVFEPEGSREIENLDIDAMWAQIQAYGLGDFIDKDDVFFLNLFDDFGAGPSFKKP